MIRTTAHCLWQVSATYVVAVSVRFKKTPEEDSASRKKWKTLILTQEIECVHSVPFTDLFAFCLDNSQRKSRTVKPRSQAPIYEDMAGVKATSQKLVPQHLEEKVVSDYSKSHVKKSTPENHYEIPSGALWPRRECQKWKTGVIYVYISMSFLLSCNFTPQIYL